MRVVNTLVDGSLQELAFQWSNATATSTTVGVGVVFKVDDGEVQEVQGSLSWSQNVNQGVDGFEHLAASRVSAATKRLIVEAMGPGDLACDFPITVDCGVHWNLNTVDDNWAEYIPDASTLEGKATYKSVIGFGKITVTRNADQTTDACPTQWHDGTDLGNPELTGDRTVQATVTYVLP